MNIIKRWTLGMGLMLLVAVSACSCSASRQLGCPTRITQAPVPASAPLEARMVFPVA